MGCGAHENSTVRRAQVEAVPGWVTFWEVSTGATKSKPVSFWIGNPSGAKQTILVVRGARCYKWYQSHSCAVRDGGANLIEDDESLRGGDCNDTDYLED